MKNLLVLFLISLSVAVPVTVQAEDAQSVIDEMIARDMARKSDVNFYVVRQSVMGQTVSQYFERTEVTLADGSTTDTFRSVSGPELQKRNAGGAEGLTPAQAEAYAQGLEQTGSAMSTEIDKGMQNAGLPPGMLKGMGSPAEPWASPDPRTMMGAGAGFVRAAGQASVETGSGQRDAESRTHDMANFAKSAKLVGVEKIDGRKAFHLRSDDIDQKEISNGQEFSIETMSVWIDNDNYVPLRMRMEGTAEVEGKKRDIFIEQNWSDYRSVPDSKMLESYRQLMRMGGVMTPDEEAQMIKARQEMAEFEKQMAEMPESQRRMMENMMGPQMEMMRKMITGGAFEIETVVSEIQVVE